MIPGKLTQAMPIQVAYCAMDDMSDVGAVEALAKVDEQLRRNKLLGTKHPCRNTEHDGVGTAFDPRLVDGDDSVAHAGDQVDVIAVAVGLCKPYRIADPDLEAAVFQVPQCLGHRGCRKKEVQVLGVPPNAGVVLQGKGAGHHIRYIGPVHLLEHFTEQLSMLRREVRRDRSADRQRLISRHSVRLDGGRQPSVVEAA